MVRLRLQRAKRKSAGRSPAVSAFSIFLLGFGLILWTLTLLGLVMMHSCRYAEFWLSGWFETHSLLQVAGAALALIAVLFLVRVMTLKVYRKSMVETLAQGLFIVGLVLVFGALKANLLSFGFPPNSAYTAAVEFIYGPQIRLVEESSLAWSYDYPPPPPDPRTLSNPSYKEMFPHRDSPWWSELEAARQCVADYDAALAAYREWEEGLDKRLAENW